MLACGAESLDEREREDHAHLTVGSEVSLDAGSGPDVGDAGASPLDASSQVADATAPASEDPCDTLTYANTGAPFFAKYCAACHRLPQPTFNNLTEISTLKHRIEARLFQMPSAPMPPPSAPLQPTAEDKQKLQQWLACTPLD